MPPRAVRRRDFSTFSFLLLAVVAVTLRTYRDSQDHPLLEEYMAIMRKHAPDPAAFDAFVKEWFFGTVVPQYLISHAEAVRVVDGGEVRARIKNVGTGRVPVQIAATRGERFAKQRTAANAWSESRAQLTLGEGEERSVMLRCSFEPQKLVVDPDVRVLSLERQKAEIDLKVKRSSGPVAAAR